MPDRSHFWSPVPGWSGAVLQSDGLRISALEPAAAWQLSGAVDHCLARLGVSPACGPRDACTGERYALRLAPGSVLLIGDASPAIDAESNFVGALASDLTDGIIVIGVEGVRATQLLTRGSEYPFESTAEHVTESARMQFADFRVAVARRPRGWRLHVERPWATALWHWLDGVRSCLLP